MDRWLTHTMRWHTHYHTMGTGHLYQGRFKSFPIESDDYFYSLLRYVERNPLRAGLVRKVENWRWSSLYRREAEDGQTLLYGWPVPMPEDWLAHILHFLPADVADSHTQIDDARKFYSHVKGTYS